MDKIIYTCSGAHLGYEFPKRKWWDFQKKERYAEFVLTDVFEQETDFEGESFKQAGISVRVRMEEYHPDKFIVHTDEYWQDEIRQAFLRCILKKRHYEVLFVVDWEGDGFAQLLPEFAMDKNYLAVFTKHPRHYDVVMEQVALECGLIGMVFTDYRDFARYQRQVCLNKNALILWGNGSNSKNTNGKKIYYHFQKGDFLVDFSLKQDYKQLYLKKRMEAEYTNLPIFLDNMVKNRYNSLVNEGLQQRGQRTDTQQSVYRSELENKLNEERKGIRLWKKRKIF